MPPLRLGSVCKRMPEDYLCKRYLGFCEELIKNPPGESWTAAEVMTDKWEASRLRLARVPAAGTDDAQCVNDAYVAPLNAARTAQAHRPYPTQFSSRYQLSRWCGS